MPVLKFPIMMLNLWIPLILRIVGSFVVKIVIDKHSGSFFNQQGSLTNKMHQIHFRLGLRPYPADGELTTVPQTP